jgi:hypothetical protein
VSLDEMPAPNRAERRLIERTSDTGYLTVAEAPIGSVAYTLEIWQTSRRIWADGRLETIVETPTIEVRLERRQLASLRPWPKGPLTLQFSDGRRLDGVIHDGRFIPQDSIATSFGTP